LDQEDEKKKNNADKPQINILDELEKPEEPTIAGRTSGG